MLKDLQKNNPNFKFAYITNTELLPKKVKDQVKSEIIVLNHPIVEDYVRLYALITFSF